MLSNSRFLTRPQQVSMVLPVALTESRIPYKELIESGRRLLFITLNWGPFSMIDHLLLSEIATWWPLAVRGWLVTPRSFSALLETAKPVCWLPQGCLCQEAATKMLSNRETKSHEILMFVSK